MDAQRPRVRSRVHGRGAEGCPATGQTLTAFVADTLRQRATEVLKGEDTPPAHPAPVRLEDVTTELAEMVRGMAATQEQRLAQIGREQLEAIRREAKRGRWRR